MLGRSLLIICLLSAVVLRWSVGFVAWNLTCYGDPLHLACDLSKTVVIHNAQFGFFKEALGHKYKGNSCLAQKGHDCWIDVTSSVSGICSGYQSCVNNVQYSVDFPHDRIAKECPHEDTGSAKPSLFVEFSCVPKTLFTKLTSASHVDTEQVGGYLASSDYGEARNGGTEWRSHQADALCRSGQEQLPYTFYLPAPNTHSQQPGSGFKETVSFVLRIKDLSLTKPTAQTPTDNAEKKYQLATGKKCSDPGKPCQKDFLKVLATLPREPDKSEETTTFPVTRICLVESQEQTDKTEEETETLLIGKTFGPLPSAFGLKFQSNLNLLDSHVIPGKGILIEYIALLCNPIRNPTGNGQVDYFFQSLPHSSHTVAYAEISCPPDRWLEPQRPLGNDVVEGSDESRASWWLKRTRDTTRICNHHSRSWSDRIPEACLTDSELEMFVTKVQMDMEHEAGLKRNQSLKSSNSESTTPNALLEVPSPPLEHTAMDEIPSKRAMKSGISVAIGVVLGFLVCLMALVLIIYSLRHRLFTEYYKKQSYPSFPDRMTRSASSFNQSTHSFYPTLNSMDWRRKLNKSKWDLFKPWRVPVWSQNLNGTYPDLPRQTIVQGFSTGGTRTPETMVIGRSNLGSQARLPRSLTSSFSLNPGYPLPTSLENVEAPNMSPWLRTNSATRINHKPQFFASSNELMNPVDGSSQFTRSWWLPWRRSFRKQRRLYTQLQRRREAHYQSQRRLMASNGISNSSSMQFGHLMSTPSCGLGSHSQMNSKVNLNCQRSVAMDGGISERQGSQLTARSNYTPVTANGFLHVNEHYSRPDEVTQLYSMLNHPLNYNYTNVDPTSGYPMTYFQPQTEMQNAVEVPASANEPLPWKSTPSGKSLSQGFRRLSSFLRNLNGSLTPPRSAREAQPHQSMQVHLDGQFNPQSMSVLNTPHYFHSGMSESSRRRLSGPQLVPHRMSVRSRSESGSAGLGLGIRSLYHLSYPAGSDPTGSMYNLDEDENSAFGDPLSISTTTATRTTRLGSIATISPGSGQLNWDQGRPLEANGLHVSTTSTIRAQTPTTQQQSNGRGRKSTIDMSHSNDPYLIPSSLKRKQAAQTATDAQRTKHLSEHDQFPSGTSSAVSSLVFGDSAEDDQDVGGAANLRPLLPTLTVGAMNTPLGRPVFLPQSSGAYSPRGWTKFPIDYAMYDETHSCSNSLARPLGDVAQTQQDLIATQLVGPTFQNLITSVKRRRNSDKDGTDSRPLSEAMISNHYYAGAELNHGPTDTQFPPQLPPRINPGPPNSGRSLSPKPQISLPPLWNRPQLNGNSNTRMSSHTKYRDEYGSIDSLYETVDQYKPAETKARSEQQLDKPPDPNLPRIDKGSLLQRQKLALPPTPGSEESLRAPVASDDEDTDAEDKPEEEPQTT